MKTDVSKRLEELEAQYVYQQTVDFKVGVRQNWLFALWGGTQWMKLSPEESRHFAQDFVDHVLDEGSDSSVASMVHHLISRGCPLPPRHEIEAAFEACYQEAWAIHQGIAQHVGDVQSWVLQ